MTLEDHQQVIDALDIVLADAERLMGRFEAHGLSAKLKEDYLALHELHGRALSERQRHLQAQAMLNGTPGLSMPLLEIKVKRLN